MTDERKKALAKMSARKFKGVSKSAVRDFCPHEAYKDILDNPRPPTYVGFKKIKIELDTRMCTSQFSKASLSCFDSKRYLITSYASRPFGHYKNSAS